MYICIVHVKALSVFIPWCVGDCHGITTFDASDNPFYLDGIISNMYLK